MRPGTEARSYISQVHPGTGFAPISSVFAPRERGDIWMGGGGGGSE